MNTGNYLFPFSLPCLLVPCQNSSSRLNFFLLLSTATFFLSTGKLRFHSRGLWNQFPFATDLELLKSKLGENKKHAQEKNNKPVSSGGRKLNNFFE